MIESETITTRDSTIRQLDSASAFHRIIDASWLFRPAFFLKILGTSTGLQANSLASSPTGLRLRSWG